MIGTLWQVIQWTALAVIAFGLLSNRWTGWAEKPWWFGLSAMSCVTTTGHCLASGRLISAAAYSMLALLAVACMVLAVRRDRADQPRHVERWDPWR